MARTRYLKIGGEYQTLIDGKAFMAAAQWGKEFVEARVTTIGRLDPSNADFVEPNTVARSIRRSPADEGSLMNLIPDELMTALLGVIDEKPELRKMACKALNGMELLPAHAQYLHDRVATYFDGGADLRADESDPRTYIPAEEQQSIRQLTAQLVSNVKDG